MRKLRLLLLPFFFVMLFFSSCEVDQEYFDETLLYGKWVSGTEFYKYNADGTGGTWDTADDVTEEEAQAFNWTLEQSELTHIHILEIGGSVPKLYTVTRLTATTLEYEDDFGVEFSYTKVN
ncbi:MAG: hypothetical protein ACOCYO_04980 [Bacteroidota bacterium]